MYWVILIPTRSDRKYWRYLGFLAMSTGRVQCSAGHTGCGCSSGGEGGLVSLQVSCQLLQLRLPLGSFAACAYGALGSDWRDSDGPSVSWLALRSHSESSGTGHLAWFSGRKGQDSLQPAPEAPPTPGGARLAKGSPRRRRLSAPPLVASTSPLRS